MPYINEVVHYYALDLERVNGTQRRCLKTQLRAFEYLRRNLMGYSIKRLAEIEGTSRSTMTKNVSMAYYRIKLYLRMKEAGRL